MKSKKWFVLLMVVLFAAVLVVGCGGGESEEPDDEPVVGSTIPHSIEDDYADCASCHSDIAESHAGFEGYEENCLDCHAQE